MSAGIHIKYRYLRNGNLCLFCDEFNRTILRELSSDNRSVFATDKFMAEMMEDFIANNSFEWISPTEVGALTDAPMLGIRDADEKITAAWGFMNYAVTSVQDELMNNGEAVWQKG